MRLRFWRKPTPFEMVRPDYLRFDGLRGGWGMAFMWHHGFETQGVDTWGSISGFDPVQEPRVGDVIATEMKSGETILWVVTESERKVDPPDMFYVKVARIGYEKDFPLRPSTWVRGPGPVLFR